MKTDNTMPRYTAQEIADEFFTDGVLWDVWGGIRPALRATNSK